MKNLIVLLMISLFLFSCNKEKEDLRTEKPEKDKPDVTEKQNGNEKTTDTEKITDIEEISFTKNNLPADIKFNGSIVGGKRWKDKNGENITIITSTTEKELKNEYGESAFSKELFAYNYANSGNGFAQLWKMNDFIKECEFDITLSFNDNSLVLTDVNQDGTGEITFMYRICCRSDVSPCGLKLLMYENSNKYALRGDARVDIEGIHEGGTYIIDKSFNSAPAGFLDFAKSHWKKYMTEKFN